jgi:hypothetical protein
MTESEGSRRSQSALVTRMRAGVRAASTGEPVLIDVHVDGVKRGTVARLGFRRYLAFSTTEKRGEYRTFKAATRAVTGSRAHERC